MQNRRLSDKWKQRLFILYVVLISFISLMNNTIFVYRSGTITTLEKRFQFTSAQLGVTATSFEVGHVGTVLFMGIFTKHIPKWVGAAGLTVGVCGILTAIPHFIYGSGMKDIDALTNDTLTNKSTGFSDLTICQTGFINRTDLCAMEAVEHRDSGYTAAYILLVISSIFLGITLSPLITIGLTFIDDTVTKKKASLYLGIVLSSDKIGNIAGLLLAAAFSRVYIDLVPTSLDPDDPRWLGAWWLGVLVMGVLTLVGSLPLFVIPEDLKIATVKDIATDLTELEELRGRTEKEELGEQTKNIPLMIRIKDFFRKLLGLLLNPVFIVNILAFASDRYFAAGWFLFLPKFLEVHFLLKTWKANVVSAIILGVASYIGVVLGGYLQARMNTLRQLKVMLVLVSLLSIAGLVVLMFVDCAAPVPRGTMSGGSCTPDGVAVDGACEVGCDVSLIIYSVITFFVVVLGAMATTPCTVITMRYVHPDLKNLALGVMTVVTSLVAWLPAPILYGLLVDSACLSRDHSCTAQGACSFYDVDKFRMYIHGATAIAKSFGLIGYIFMFFKLDESKMMKDDSD